jgi:hypothetical protein
MPVPFLQPIPFNSNGSLVALGQLGMKTKPPISRAEQRAWREVAAALRRVRRAQKQAQRKGDKNAPR